MQTTAKKSLGDVREKNSVIEKHMVFCYWAARVNCAGGGDFIETGEESCPLVFKMMAPRCQAMIFGKTINGNLFFSHHQECAEISVFPWQRALVLNGDLVLVGVGARDLGVALAIPVCPKLYEIASSQDFIQISCYSPGEKSLTEHSPRTIPLFRAESLSDLGNHTKLILESSS